MHAVMQTCLCEDGLSLSLMPKDRRHRLLWQWKAGEVLWASQLLCSSRFHGSPGGGVGGRGVE